MLSRIQRSTLIVAVIAATAVVVSVRQVPLARAATCDAHVRPGYNVQRVIDARPTGSVICFAPGVYRIRTALVPKARDVLRGARGAILSGSKRLTTFVRQGGFWVARNQTQQRRVGDDLCKPASYLGCRYAEGVYVDRHPLRQVTAKSALGRGKFFFDYGANEIWLGTNPTGHHVETSVAPSAVVGFGGNQPGVVVRGFVIEMFASDKEGLIAAVKPGNGWIIEQNEIRLNHRMGIYANPGVIIRNNKIHHNGQSAIRGQGDGVKVLGNKILHNNVEDFAFWSAAGVRFTHTKHVVMRGNLVAYNDGPGLKTDTDNIYVTYEHNRLIKNQGPGIAHEKGYQATIVGNYLRNNALAERGDGPSARGQIMINSSSDVEIARNTIVSGVRVNSVILRDDNRGTGPFGEYAVKHARVHDNVVRMVRGSYFGLFGHRSLELFSSWGNRFQGNHYFLRRRAAKYWGWRANILGIAGWKAAGNDTGGTFKRWL